MKAVKAWLDSAFSAYHPVAAFALKAAAIGGAIGLLLVFLAVLLHEWS